MNFNPQMFETIFSAGAGGVVTLTGKLIFDYVQKRRKNKAVAINEAAAVQIEKIKDSQTLVPWLAQHLQEEDRKFREQVSNLQAGMDKLRAEMFVMKEQIWKLEEEKRGLVQTSIRQQDEIHSQRIEIACLRKQLEDGGRDC